jgi:hypothetical protein
MKTKLLLAAIMSIAIMGCSSHRGFANSGNCVVCGKRAVWNSIGYCEKHYTFQKEQSLRGAVAKR